NAVGKVGAAVSDLFFQFVGVGAYLFPFFLIALGWNFFRTEGKKIPRRAWVGFLLLVVTLSSFAESIKDRSAGAVPSPHLEGGGAGRLLSHFFLNYFAPVGSAILLFSFFLLGWTLLTSFSLWNGFNRLSDAFRAARTWGRERLLIRQSQKKRRLASFKKEKGDPTIVQTPATDPTLPQITLPPQQEVFSFARDKESGDYRLPPLSLLSDPSPHSKRMMEEEWVAQSQILEKKLLDFDVEGRVTQVHPGPVVTMFEFEPAPGIKLNRITNLSDDLALAMKAAQVRIVAPLPGKSTIGIEIPNSVREEVLLKEILSSIPFNQLSSKIRLALGKDIFGAPVSADLGAMPHLLVAGSTGSGKSVGLNGMILSVLFTATPSEVKILMIDPKMLELSLYDGIPHLLAPVIVRPKAASEALKKIVAEMQRRYQLLAEKGVRNIEAYNKLIQNKPQSPPAKTVDGPVENPADPGPREHVPLPYIVIFIDELADLMMVAPRDVEDSITRLAQMARASGIHLVLATQRPSVDVLTGVIKANFPARIAYCVSSKTDSRTILDANGAEQLLGKGDMLYLSAGTGRILRIHGAYVSEEEVKKVVTFIKEQASPHYEGTFSEETAQPENSTLDDRDELYEQARELVISTGQASASFIQRRMRVGYPRAARMIEMMEEDGLIGPSVGGKPREILVKRETETNL
ncbi:MAG TPA: DNA translocase FtsK, partial [Candidatus Manganitrophaceae bacterium]|nr:DNA translocase FtsK [Candidatus Manganitrophaceae bacterium]